MNYKTYVFGFLVAAIIPTVLFKFSVTSSLGCDASGGGADKFMAYCAVDTHGHYDHAAYLFNLEDGLANHIRQANLLFLGDSRPQFAFSSTSLTDFVTRHANVRPYLLGFGFGEQSVFSAAVLDKFKPTPAIVVINVDPFFSKYTSAHAEQLLGNGPLEENNARIKKLWHRISEAACDGKLPMAGHLICGSYNTVYRSVTDGRWILHNKLVGTTPVSEKKKVPRDDESITAFSANAEVFLSRFSVDRRCVVLTYVPTVDSTPFIAKGMAERLGTRYIAPQLASLTTFDGAHLDTASSERWSAAFLKELEPVLASCLH